MNKHSVRTLSKKKIRIPVLDCAPLIAFSGAVPSYFVARIKLVPVASPLPQTAQARFR